MGPRLSAFFFFFFCLLVAAFQAQAATVFNINQFGGKPDGEISKAFCAAWTAACQSPTASQILIPPGTYCLEAVEFVGPCKAPIEIKIDGTLRSNPDPASFKKDQMWIMIKYVSFLTISGCGVLDGQGGVKAWGMVTSKSMTKQCGLQYNLSLNFINDSTITGITTKDSKNFHVQLIAANRVTFDNFHICAPGDSPNTDGIHMGWSKDITVKNSIIRTGDDCISMGDGNERINIEAVTCGPGHGISIGSLGKMDNEKPVLGVCVKNCTFDSTQNGVRIKTWPDSKPGCVSDINFQDLSMNMVENPVVIEQDYCPAHNCKLDKPSMVKISKVTVKNVKGTSKCPSVVKLKCSAANPCTDICISDIDLSYQGPLGPAKQECCNTKPVYSGKQCPPGCPP